MNQRRVFILRCAAPVAAVLLFAGGCGSGQDSDLFGPQPSGAGAGGGGGGGTGGATVSSSSANGGAGTTSGSGGQAGAGGACQNWYCDGDQDGFGDPNVSVMSCDPPAGGDAMCPGPYVESMDDCGPGDPMAFPGQMQFFGTPVLPPPPALPFDYNCDGMEELDTTQLYNGGMNMNCFMECFFMPNPPRGFGPNAQCGTTSEYYQCSFPGFGSCVLSMVMAPEPLRCR